MPKFYGEVGYASDTVEDEDGSGIWKDEIVEYSYFGDVLRNVRRLEESETLNDNITVSNTISILADEFANTHFHAIRYIRWAGTLWTVTSVEVKSPRLLLTLGNVYNGPIAIVEE